MSHPQGVNRVLGTIDQFMANAKMAAESGTCPAGAHLSGYEECVFYIVNHSPMTDYNFSHHLF
jgi:hypothetical protein